MRPLSVSNGVQRSGDAQSDCLNVSSLYSVLLNFASAILGFAQVAYE